MVKSRSEIREEIYELQILADKHYLDQEDETFQKINNDINTLKLLL